MAGAYDGSGSASQLVDIEGQVHGMIELKCPRCGWVHAGVSELDAQGWVDDSNRDSVIRGESPTATIELYQRCFQCHASADDFVVAGPEDAPAGCSIQPVILPIRFGTDRYEAT